MTNQELDAIEARIQDYLVTSADIANLLAEVRRLQELRTLDKTNQSGGDAIAGMLEMSCCRRTIQRYH